MNQISVTDPVKMFACRKIGKNIPYSLPTYWIEEAESYLTEDAEIVRIVIYPFDENEEV